MKLTFDIKNLSSGFLQIEELQMTIEAEPEVLIENMKHYKEFAEFLKALD